MDIRQAITEAAITKKLVVQGQQLGTVPAGILDLTDLEELTLIDCAIRELPAAMVRLRNLKILGLSLNPLGNLPAVIPKLTSLEQLRLAGTGIRSLPENFRDLHRLSVLSLSGNNITHFPEPLRNMPGLEYLDLDSNLLEWLPLELSGMRGLARFVLRNNRISDFPPALLDLAGLRILDLSHKGPRLNLFSRATRESAVTGNRFGGTPLLSLPPWIDALSELEWLLLDDNQLDHVPSSVGRLGRLKVLCLPGNRLSAVPEELPASLEYLDLSRNRISAPPRTLSRLTRLEHLDLQENPLQIPPEILSTLNAKSIADYLCRLGGDTRPLNEAKVLIVGEASVGKTSLVKRLVHNEFDPYERKTDGIRTTRWGMDGVTLNIWDFGGQEIMHATHQFFLTRRSVYLLVVDARQDEEQNRLEYWLKIIQSFSDGSKVILVGNKTDEGPLDIDKRGLRFKYPDVCGAIGVSCLTGDGIGDLRTAIGELVDGMSHIRDPLPGGFFSVKQHLEWMDRNYISFEEYHQICKENGIMPRASQELLIDFLHDLGTVLCFRDDPRLADTNILNPGWVTAGVYRILNSHLAAQRKGLLTTGDVHTILESIEYPPERRLFIIDMMKRFELCFDCEGTFLVPDLLTKEEPDTGSWDDALEFVIRYEILPPSVMCRLIVRMHRVISKRTVWRTGVVLATGDNRALVKADREDATITIQVTGARGGRRDLLAAIRLEARSIAQTIPGLVAEELVPIPRNPGVRVPYSHLLELEAAGRNTVVPQGMVTDVPIKQLLNGVEAPTERPSPVRPATGGWRHAAEPAIEWNSRTALTFAGILLASLLLVFGAATVGGLYLGSSLLPALGASIVAVSTIAVFVLRAAGRLSEQGFLDALKELLSKKGP